MSATRASLVPRRHVRALAVTAALTLATVTACSAANSGGGTGSTAAPSTAPTKILYPAPAGGNGGSTDTGVTATSINLALLYSISGPDPGATAGALRGAQAYINYVNSNGGIYGRKLTITPYDNGFDPTKSVTDCTQIVPKYFAATGGFAVGDQTCYNLLKSSSFPWFQYSGDPQIAMLPNYVFPDTGSPETIPTTGEVALKQEFPSVKKVAVLYANEPGELTGAQETAAALESAGFQVVLTLPIDETAASFANYVVKIRQSGAQAIDADDATIQLDSRLAAAMQQQGYTPAFAEGDATYASNWHQLAGSAAAGWTSGLNVLPYLDSSTMEATPGGKNFLAWYNKTNPGEPIDLFAVFGWSSTQLLVQAMVAAGPKLTRTALLSAASKIGTYDAGGIFAPSNPTQKTYTTCTVEVESTSTGYKQLLPTKPGFDCNLPGAKILTTSAG